MKKTQKCYIKSLGSGEREGKKWTDVRSLSFLWTILLSGESDSSSSSSTTAIKLTNVQISPFLFLTQSQKSYFLRRNGFLLFILEEVCR